MLLLIRKKRTTAEQYKNNLWLLSSPVEETSIKAGQDIIFFYKPNIND